MTITNDATPSAPPMDDEINVQETVPVVQATALPLGSSISSSTPPRPPPNVAVPAGMVAKSVTTTYADGRQVTVTEYQQAGASTATSPSSAVATSAAPVQVQVAASAYHPPRRDLGSRPVNITCPYCTQTSKTRTNHNCGDCTLISVILLLLFCFPFFWIPFICPSCQDVEHHCGNCGRLVGKSRAECCS